MLNKVRAVLYAPLFAEYNYAGHQLQAGEHLSHLTEENYALGSVPHEAIFATGYYGCSCGADYASA